MTLRGLAANQSTWRDPVSRACVPTTINPLYPRSKVVSSSIVRSDCHLSALRLAVQGLLGASIKWQAGWSE